MAAGSNRRNLRTNLQQLPRDNTPPLLDRIYSAAAVPQRALRPDNRARYGSGRQLSDETLPTVVGNWTGTKELKGRQDQRTLLFLCIFPRGSGSDGGPDFACPL